MSNAKRVFLSHTSDDRVFAGQLARLMTERGASVFLDANMTVGDDWTSALRREIENASALVLLLPSKTAAHRNNLWFEAGAAKALGKRVLAVRPPHARLGDVPSDIADVFILDANERSLALIADTLVEAVPENAEELH